MLPASQNFLRLYTEVKIVKYSRKCNARENLGRKKQASVCWKFDKGGIYVGRGRGDKSEGRITGYRTYF